MTVILKEAPIDETRCRGCKAVIQFAMCEADLSPCWPDSDYTSRGEPGAGVKCPRCRTLTPVDAPQSLIDAVHERTARAAR